jgi:NAD-dependent deacetylase
MLPDASGNFRLDTDKPTVVVLTGAGMSAESGIPTFRDANGLWEAQPHAGHYALAQLEQHCQVVIITQNVDGLHERAGSTRVLHLHGELRKVRSVAHPEFIYDIEGREIQLGDLCEHGHQLRPHIVWFGEDVPNIMLAAELCRQADYFIIAGTSLVVYPAAGLRDYVPAEAQQYLVDNKLPAISLRHFTAHEMPASQGIPLVVADILQRINTPA